MKRIYLIHIHSQSFVKSQKETLWVKIFLEKTETFQSEHLVDRPHYKYVLQKPFDKWEQSFYVKFRFSQKTTKIWPNFPFDLNFTK